LQGRKVLDVGAMNAAFESAARGHGVDVVSLDKEVAPGDFAPPADSRFVIANATELPFGDGTFDYVLAHMSAMNYVEDAYRDKDYAQYIEAVLREAYRVLRPGGQFRFTETALDDEALRNNAEVRPDRHSVAYGEWRMKREFRFLEEILRRVGFCELRIERYPESHPGKEEYLLSHYYIALK